MAAPHTVVVTDLDGTLLDADTYRWDAAEPALQALRRRHVDLVLATSKTRAELESLRAQLGHAGPFIVENGSALFVPKGVFTTAIPGAVERDGYDVVEFGTRYAAIRTALSDIAARLGVDVRGFGDCSIDEVSRLTGLPHTEAARAKDREYDEAFWITRGQAELYEWQREAAEHGLQVTRGGRFFHLLGHADKGLAFRHLMEHYRRHYEQVVTIGIGDSANDLPMLAVVDVPILVQRPNGSYESSIELPRLIHAPGIGPRGWCTALLELLNAA